MFVRPYLAEGDDLDEEVQSWQLRFWLRSCTLWPNLKTKVKRADYVAERMDEIEQLFIEQLNECRYEAVGDLAKAIDQTVNRYIKTTKMERRQAAAPLDRVDLTGWVRAGEILGFISFGGADTGGDDSVPASGLAGASD